MTPCANDGCTNAGTVCMRFRGNRAAMVCGPHVFIYKRLGWWVPAGEREPLPMSMRSPEGEARYQDHKAKGRLLPLSEVTSMRAWTYWRLIPNSFPYDAVFSKHDMLVPKRVFSQLSDMTLPEMAELYLIKQELMGSYDCFIENTPSKQSVTVHYHVHCAVYIAERRAA